jgi:hypothetical protein
MSQAEKVARFAELHARGSASYETLQAPNVSRLAGE